MGKGMELQKCHLEKGRLKEELKRDIQNRISIGGNLRSLGKKKYPGTDIKTSTVLCKDRHVVCTQNPMGTTSQQAS